MKGKVKHMGSAPKDAPKPVKYAQIDKQGRIPYGKTAPAPMSAKRVKYDAGHGPKLTARGMGAAKKGGDYIGC
ncbi:MAG: hypothetical protein ACPHGY_02535 [Rhodospirillaceae bacterium]|jgi:hypothetical protein